MLTNTSYTDSNAATSPITIVFVRVGFGTASHVVNAVLLTAVLSATNSCFYGSSRMLLSLARSGQAPSFFGWVNRRGVPVPSLLYVSFHLFHSILLMIEFPAASLSSSLSYPSSLRSGPPVPCSPGLSIWGRSQTCLSGCPSAASRSVSVLHGTHREGHSPICRINNHSFRSSLWAFSSLVQ
jgi:hypothetical protein